jgi:N-glycosylase/DNA lyase
MKYFLPEKIKEHYKKNNAMIKKKLDEFSEVPESEYFYELCFCFCTPQSKAKHAIEVVEKLKAHDFQNKQFNPVKILSDKSHYIRFHNQKSKNILNMKSIYPEILKLLKSDLMPAEKRLWLAQNVKGLGMKESSHFLRNVGYRNLAILDRHILKHLVECGVFKEIPKVGSIKNYLDVEKKFLKFSDSTVIPIDELDLLFWSYETGEVLK